MLRLGQIHAGARWHIHEQIDRIGYCQFAEHGEIQVIFIVIGLRRYLHTKKRMGHFAAGFCRAKDHGALYAPIGAN